MLKLSTEQQTILDSLLDWHKTAGRSPFVTMGGYAGTGKTTLIGYLRNQIHKENPKIKVAFVSYTGKAARVLRNKLLDVNALHKQDFCSTIHSLMYKPIEKDDIIIGWERRQEVEYDLIIVDEASMIDHEIWSDMLDYQIPIIAVGDHGQLPPIKGSFNLMGNPELKLEHIHRQAEGNPIIKIATMARKTGFIPFGDYGNGVKKLDKKDEDSRERITELLQGYDADTLVLCGYNNTRVKLNNFIRNALERYSENPKSGDRVICLRNNHEQEIYNGMIGTIMSITPDKEDSYYAEIELDGEELFYKGIISAKQFNLSEAMNFTKRRREILSMDLFDYGYALTVHKAQGSQAKRVILFEERFKQIDDDMWRRWLYTAVTRAEEELYLVA